VVPAGEHALRKILLVACLMAQSMAISTVAALACAGPRTILLEDFRFVDDAWTQSANLIITRGKATVRSDPGGGRFEFYGNGTYGDVDMCLTVAMPADAKGNVPNPPGVGLAFWGPDGTSIYVANIYTNGSAAVFRHVDKVWTLVTKRDALTPPVNTEPGTQNVLRMTLVGNTAVFSVNNQRVAGFRSDLPASSRGRIGIFVQSDASRSVPFEVLGLKVTDVLKE
jgi:hypothetical protein